MKKIIAMILVCIMAATMLVACGSTASAPAAAPAADVKLPDWAAGLSDAAAAKYADLQAKGKVVLGTSADYPPFEFHMDIDGVDTILGYDITMGQYIADMLGVELEIVDMSFDNLVISLSKGDFDMVIAAMSGTEERKKAIDFSNVYRKAGNFIVALNENVDKFEKPEDLANAENVGAQRGTIPADTAVKYAGEEKVVQIVKIPDMMQEVIAGKIEVAVCDDVVAVAYANEREELSFKDINIPSETEGLMIGIQKGNEGFVELINAILATISDETNMTWLNEAQEISGVEAE